MRRVDLVFVLFLLTVSLCLAGCSSSDEGKDQPDHEQKQTVEIHFAFYCEWTVSNPEIEEEFDSYIKDYLSTGVARHKISVYNADNVSSGSTPILSYEVERQITEEGYDFSLPITLPSGNYVVKAWTDFYETESSKPFYDTSGFPNIMLTRHSGIADYQDAFSGSQTFSAEETTTQVKVSMNRPVGRYLLSSRNFSELLEETGYSIEDVSIVVVYAGFYPDTYSVITDRLTDSITGEYYAIKPDSSTDGSALVGADFMLMNSGKSSVTLQIGLANPNGELIAKSETMSVPMKRNEVTLIKGYLLSKTSGDGGGFDLDTGFDGDFIIRP